MKFNLSLLVSLLAVAVFANQDYTCVSISEIVPSSWCQSNCNHNPSFCPPLYCACAANGTTPNVTVSTPSTPSNCSSISVLVSDSWCQSNCNNAPSFCPATLCTCGINSTTPTPTTRNCVAVTVVATDSWCDHSCNSPTPYCPSSVCSCTWAPATPTVTNSTCKSIRPPVTDAWCRWNCPVFCPSDDCDCNSTKPVPPSSTANVTYHSTCPTATDGWCQAICTLDPSASACLACCSNVTVPPAPVVYYVATCAEASDVWCQAVCTANAWDQSCQECCRPNTTVVPSAARVYQSFCELATDDWCQALCTANPNDQNCQICCTTNPAFPSTLLFNASSPVLSDLCSPRGIFFWDGYVGVACAGTGGDNCTGSTCTGTTGSVIAGVAGGPTFEVVTGLPSVATVVGGVASAVTGPSQLGFTTDGLGLVLVGEPGSKIVSVIVSGKKGLFPFQEFVDIYALENATNPDGGGIKSNPFDFVVYGNKVLISDAGANTIWQLINPDSAPVLSKFYTFPRVTHNCIPVGTGRCASAPASGGPFYCCGSTVGNLTTYAADFVPTGMVLRPFSNEVFVGSLTGVYWNSDDAKVVSFNLLDATPTPKVVAWGFNAIISIAFDGPNNLYVLEQNFNGLGTFSGNHRLTYVDLSTGSKTVIPTSLNEPAHITVSNGWLYASNNANHATIGDCAGTVERINLHP